MIFSHCFRQHVAQVIKRQFSSVASWSQQNVEFWRLWFRCPVLSKRPWTPADIQKRIHRVQVSCWMFGWIIVVLVGLQQSTVLWAFVPECRSPTLYVLAGTAAKRPHNLPETSSFHNLPVPPKYPTSGSFTFKNSQNNNIPMSTRTGEQRFEGKTNNVSAVQIKTFC